MYMVGVSFSPDEEEKRGEKKKEKGEEVSMYSKRERRRGGAAKLSTEGVFVVLTHSLTGWSKRNEGKDRTEARNTHILS